MRSMVGILVLLYTKKDRKRGLTKSAKESSSCPIKLLFFLHLATFPSMKSKNNPNGMKANAAQRFACADGGPRQYRIEENIDMTPQKPGSPLVSILCVCSVYGAYH
jgi:hypothetical protein